MSDKQQILSAFNNFTEVYEKMGWKEWSFEDYEEFIMYIVSSDVYEKLNNINTDQSIWTYEKETNDILLSNPDDYIFVMTYNKPPANKKEKSLFLVHDYSEDD